jgi:hypothetical protein
MEAISGQSPSGKTRDTGRKEKCIGHIAQENGRGSKVRRY